MLKDLMAIRTYLSNLHTMPTASRQVGKALIPGIAARPMSKKYKENVKGVLQAIIKCAILWGYLDVDHNPISLVTLKHDRRNEPKKRLKVPLTQREINLLLADPETLVHVKMLMALCLFNGLRISEALALRVDDIDFVNNIVNIERGIVGKNIGDTKSDSSRCQVPLNLPVKHRLHVFMECGTPINGWLFGSIVTGRPFHRDSLQVDHLAPAGKRAGVAGLGWHTFRHTYAFFQSQMGLNIDPKTQMMAMRHADIATTMKYGVDGGSIELLRSANDLVVKRMLEAGQD